MSATCHPDDRPERPTADGRDYDAEGRFRLNAAARDPAAADLLRPRAASGERRLSGRLERMRTIVVDCRTVQSEADFWSAYVKSAEPDDYCERCDALHDNGRQQQPHSREER